MAVEARLLDVEARTGRIPAVLWEVPEARGSALVLPGGARAGSRLGGSPARPDLHYTRALLLELGLSVLELWWDAESAPARAGPDQDAWLDEHGPPAVRAAADAGELRALVGRSFGTCAVARLLLQGHAAPPAVIWVAPLLRREDVRAALEGTAASALVVGGTLDEAFDPAAAEELASRGATVSLVDGANHGLDVGGAAASARALADVLDAMRSFLERRL